MRGLVYRKSLEIKISYLLCKTCRKPYQVYLVTFNEGCSVFTQRVSILKHQIGSFQITRKSCNIKRQTIMYNIWIIANLLLLNNWSTWPIKSIHFNDHIPFKTLLDKRLNTLERSHILTTHATLISDHTVTSLKFSRVFPAGNTAYPSATKYSPGIWISMWPKKLW